MEKIARPHPKPLDKTKQGVDVLKLLREANSMRSAPPPASAQTTAPLSSSNYQLNLYPNKSNLNTPLPLVSKTGICRFQLIESSYGMRLGCLIFTADRRVQGIIPSDIVVKGRLGIKACNEFIQQCLMSNRRIVAPVSIYSYQAQLNGPFVKYNKDLAAAPKPVAVYEIKENENVITFYVVPVDLTADIEIGSLKFPRVEISAHGYNLSFMGLLVTKKVGPVEHVNALPLDLVFKEDGTVQSTSEIEKLEQHKQLAEKRVEEKLAQVAEAEAKKDQDSRKLADEREKLEVEMKKVAKFCIEHGSDMLNRLKKISGAITSTPFLFEHDPNHDRFLSLLELERLENRETTESSVPLTSDGQEIVNEELVESECLKSHVTKERKGGGKKALPRKK